MVMRKLYMRNLKLEKEIRKLQNAEAEVCCSAKLSDYYSRLLGEVQYMILYYYHFARRH
jgi:hypothetical protein